MANEFYALMGRMRYITRWGLMRNTFSENISEHSHMTPGHSEPPRPRP